MKEGNVISTIFSYISKISRLQNQHDILLVLADMAKELTAADRSTLWLVDTKHDELWSKVAHGVDTIRIPKQSGIVGNVIKQAKAEIIANVNDDARFNATVDKQTGYVTKSMMVIPLLSETQEVVGAFQVINKVNDETFTEQDLELLTLAASYAAEELQKAKLIEEIELTQKEVVFTMGAIGELRSKETGNHVKRVAQYSYILAKAYGLTPHECSVIKEASPTHDIGKVAIPDAILNKPGRFNDEEREIMNHHATLGYEMLKHSDRELLQAAAIVAHQHHEKYDGTGYPRGLKGDDIHIYGRITALADVFDALAAQRVYKEAWELERIYKLFKEERGKHFDPTLIDLFFENLDEILEVKERLEDLVGA